MCFFANSAVFGQVNGYVGPVITNPSIWGIPIREGGQTGPNAKPITTNNNPVTTAQWHFVGRQNETSSIDWIYAMVTTDKKETVAAGYGNNTLGQHSGTIFKVDHNGNLVWSDAVLPSSETTINLSGSTPTPVGKNDFWAVAKGQEGFVAVGRGYYGWLIVEVDMNGNYINGTPIDVVPPSTPTSSDATGSASIPGSIGGYALSVAVDPTTNSLQNIIVGGMISGSGVSVGGMVGLTYSGSTWTTTGSYYGGYSGYGSAINKILTRPNGSGGYDIYGCGAISESGDNATSPTTSTLSTSGYTFTLYNKDIWVVHTDNTFASGAYDNYNKSNITVYDATTSAYEPINYSYTDPNIYPYQETGPLSARNIDPSTQYIEWMQAPLTYSESPATYYLNANNNINET